MSDLKINWNNLPPLWTAFQDVGDQAVWVANYFSRYVCDTSGIDYDVCALAPLKPAFGKADAWFRDMDDQFTTHWNGLEEAVAATIKHIDAVDDHIAHDMARYTSEIEIRGGKIVTYAEADITDFHLVDIHDTLTPPEDGKDQLTGENGKEGHDKDFMAISRGYDEARNRINGIIGTINDVSPFPDIPSLPDKSISDYLVYPLSGNYKRLQANASACRQVGAAMDTWQGNVTKVAAKSHTAFAGQTGTAFAAQLGLYVTVMEGVQVAAKAGGAVLDQIALASERIAIRVERAIISLGKALFRLLKKVAARVSGIVGWLTTAVDVISKGTAAFDDIIRDVELVTAIISNVHSLVGEVKAWAALQARRLDDFQELVKAVEALPDVSTLTSLSAVESADVVRVKQAVDQIRTDFGSDAPGSEQSVIDKIDHVLGKDGDGKGGPPEPDAPGPGRTATSSPSSPATPAATPQPPGSVVTGPADRFDATGEPPAATTAADDLRGVVEARADSDLDAALARLDESVSDWEETDDGLLDESTQALLDAVSGADDAPLSWRSLHERVERGRLTWQGFWLAPQDEPGGVLLISAVLRRQTEVAGEVLTRVRAEIAESREDH